MSIRIECPECQSSFRVEEGVRGKTVRCKKCGESLPANRRRQADEAPEAEPNPVRSRIGQFQVGRIAPPGRGERLPRRGRLVCLPGSFW